MRKFFLMDEDGFWYAVPVDKRGFFRDLDRKVMHSQVNLDVWETEFGSMRLTEGVSDYSFDDMQEDIEE
jgi:hypothetical protein